VRADRRSVYLQRGLPVCDDFRKECYNATQALISEASPVPLDLSVALAGMVIFLKLMFNHRKLVKKFRLGLQISNFMNL
jgi:hypothetical protein